MQGELFSNRTRLNGLISNDKIIKNCWIRTFSHVLELAAFLIEILQHFQDNGDITDYGAKVRLFLDKLEEIVVLGNDLFITDKDQNVGMDS